MPHLRQWPRTTMVGLTMVTAIASIATTNSMANERRHACSAHPNAHPHSQSTTLSGPTNAFGDVTHPTLSWPLDVAVYEGAILGLYIDNDPAPNAFFDYTCSDGAYDGHLGTDFGIPSFREMDDGTPIYAMAAGTVIFKQDGNFDRNTEWPPPDDGNYLGIDHGGGSQGWYYHLRRNSIAVELGEEVAAGQLIGMIGSSGFSFGPHLHFDLGAYTPDWEPRDPWSGACNPEESLWIDQVDYVGDDPIFIHGAGVTTEPAVGGDFSNIPYANLIEGFSKPAVVGTNEEEIAVWVQYQGNIGDEFRIEVWDPDNNLFTWFDFTLAFKAYLNTSPFWFTWDSRVDSEDHGTWLARVLIDGNVVQEIPFEVGTATEFGPRFTKAGASFYVDGSTQRDTLRLSALGQSATFSLVDPPTYLSLEDDSVLVVATSSDQPQRSAFHKAVAIDGSARTDTFHIHVVDPTKEPDTPADTPDIQPADPSLGSLTAWPSPFHDEVAIEFRQHENVKSGETVSVSVHDVIGRRVRTLGVRALNGGLDPASAVAFRWDGRDEFGRELESSVYWIIATTDSGATRTRVVKIR